MKTSTIIKQSIVMLGLSFDSSEKSRYKLVNFLKFLRRFVPVRVLANSILHFSELWIPEVRPRNAKIFCERKLLSASKDFAEDAFAKRL